jgi:hypothetical protein
MRKVDTETRRYSVQRYKLFRRILFPYSGAVPLTFKQGLRVILGWILPIPVIVSLGTGLFATALSDSPAQILSSMLFAFLSGVFIFGGLGLLIIFMGNRAARFHQGRNVPGANNN